MSEDIDLTVSLVSGNQARLTIDCLHSLLKGMDQSISCEIILVDNASREQIAEKVAELFPQVKVVKNAGVKGFGSNHNQVLAVARGRYILILNDDTIVPPLACQRLVSFADQHREAGFVGPRLLNSDGSLQKSAYRFPSPQLILGQALLLHKTLGWIFDDYSNWKHDRIRAVEFLSGAALLVRREMVKQVGVFDENFFMYAEETDWCFRAAKAGWKVLFVPDIQIIHLGGQSTLELKPQRSAELLRSHDYFLKKHYGQFGWIAFKAFAFMKYLPRVALAQVLGWSQEKRDAEMDYLLWSIGMLKRPGLAEQNQARD